MSNEDMNTWDPGYAHEKAEWSYFQKLINIHEKQNPKRGQCTRTRTFVCVCVLYALSYDQSRFFLLQFGQSLLIYKSTCTPSQTAFKF